MVVSQDGNSRVWERTTTEDVVNGKAVLKKHHYMELCDGVNFGTVTSGMNQKKKSIFYRMVPGRKRSKANCKPSFRLTSMKV